MGDQESDSSSSFAGDRLQPIVDNPTAGSDEIIANESDRGKQNSQCQSLWTIQNVILKQLLIKLFTKV